MSFDIKDAILSGAIQLPAGTTVTTAAGVQIDLSNATLAFGASSVFKSGKAGTVPAPTAGDITAGRILSASGAWIDKPTGGGGGSGGSSTTGTVLTYQSDGDTNGVFFYLGKQANGGTWANPVTAGAVALTASNVTGGNQANNIACLANRDPSDFWIQQADGNFVQIDLGATHALIPSAVTVTNRTDTSNALTTAKLQGSNSATTGFVDLATLNLNFNAASQAVTTTVAGVATAYRYFRVVRVGNTSSGDQYLCVGELELYGTLNTTTTTTGTGGGSSGGGSSSASTPAIIQQTFARGGGTQSLVTPAAPTAGNLLLIVMVGYSGAAGMSAPAGWTVIYAGGPISAQSAWVGYKIADGTEGTPTYSFGYGDNANLAYFEISAPFNVTATVNGGNYNNGSLIVPTTASYRGSLRIIACEWDNTTNVTGVASGGTMLNNFTGGGNHRGAIAYTTGSPLVPLVFSLDGGPDRPEVLLVEISG